MNTNLRNFALWVIIVLLLLALFTLFNTPGQRPSAQDISFSQLLNEVDQGRVKDVLIQGPEIHGTFTDGRPFQTYAPNDPTLIQRLYGKGVSITARPLSENVPWFVSLLVSWLPFIALIGVWIFLSRQMQGAGGKALGFGKSRAKLLTEAASTRPSRTCRRSSSSCATPANSSAWVARFRAACCWSARPAPARR
jgi:cell division protease FtsH